MSYFDPLHFPISDFFLSNLASWEPHSPGECGDGSDFFRQIFGSDVDYVFFMSIVPLSS